jgi:hypothetical protein
MKISFLALLLAFFPAQDKPTDDLPIPAIGEITRTDGKTRASREERALTCYLLATRVHPVAEEGYVILTDHKEEAPLASLKRLADHHEGEIVRVDDLSAINSDSGALKRLMPRFVAIAPRQETYGEKMLWSILDILSRLDDDPELDAFPGLLVAPDQESLDALITRSIEHRPQTRKDFRPFVIGQVVNGSPNGIRSLQKVGIMRRLFAGMGYETPAFVTLKAKGAKQRQITGEDIWYAVEPDEKKMLRAIPSEARKALEESSLVVMYGHGTPGVVCSIEVSAFETIDMTGKIVLCGSCFSGAPRRWDNPLPARIKDGPDRERFLMRTVRNGATVSFGHMKFNGGFPYLFPVLEHWLEGGTVGEGYQRILNAILSQLRKTPAEVLGGDRRALLAGNMMLYVVIGDPALRPFDGNLSRETDHR